MSARTRALGFGAAALLCAILAAAAAGSYGTRAAQRYGELRPVVVTRAAIPRRTRFDPGRVGTLLEVRRVPADFAPPDALSDPAQALGGEVATELPQGSYLTRAELATKRAAGNGTSSPLVGRSPVELTVTGGEALASLTSHRARVDVVVTTEPGPGPNSGRTYVGAPAVPLLDVRRDRDAGAVAGEGGSIATLALRRKQALELIRAESFARSIRLLVH